MKERHEDPVAIIRRALKRGPVGFGPCPSDEEIARVTAAAIDQMSEEFTDHVAHCATCLEKLLLV